MSKVYIRLLMISAILSVGCLGACATGSHRRTPSATEEDGVPAVPRALSADYVAPKDITKIKVAFFDADSTLRVSLSGSVSANHAKDVKLLPYMAADLRELADRGFLIYIVSNQGGVGAGVISMETADSALQQTIRLIRADGGVIHGYDFAEDDLDRKPKPAMKDLLEADLKTKYGPSAKIDLVESFMVGDSAYKKDVDFDPTTKKPGIHFSNADRLFAENVGVKFYEPSDFFGWREYGVDIFTKAEEVETFLKKCESDPDCFAKLRLANCKNFLKSR